MDPDLVLLDVNETLVSLDEVRVRLGMVGLAGDDLELWFARTLRDGFALQAAGTPRPFAEVAAAALRGTALSVTGREVPDHAVSRVLEGFRDAEMHHDVPAGLDLLRDAGVRLATLTNGSVEVSSAMLARNGLDGYVEATLSVDDAGAWKPAPAAYRWACERLGVAPERTALLAVHSWDCHGARQAGLVSAWCARLEGSYVAAYDAPTVTGEDLPAAAAALLALP